MAPSPWAILRAASYSSVNPIALFLRPSSSSSVSSSSSFLRRFALAVRRYESPQPHRRQTGIGLKTCGVRAFKTIASASLATAAHTCSRYSRSEPFHRLLSPHGNTGKTLPVQARDRRKLHPRRPRLLSQAWHPLVDASRQFLQDISPITDRLYGMSRGWPFARTTD